ncbi:uncharacterized protein DS421_17g583730 [Arachis hypogaea]|nr:uncharacterized protein DS421_17g583730 [Arachis hypogaea]
MRLTPNGEDDEDWRSCQAGCVVRGSSTPLPLLGFRHNLVTLVEPLMRLCIRVIRLCVYKVIYIFFII